MGCCFFIPSSKSSVDFTLVNFAFQTSHISSPGQPDVTNSCHIGQWSLVRYQLLGDDRCAHMCDLRARLSLRNNIGTSWKGTFQSSSPFYSSHIFSFFNLFRQFSLIFFLLLLCFLLTFLFFLHISPSTFPSLMQEFLCKKLLFLILSNLLHNDKDDMKGKFIMQNLRLCGRCTSIKYILKNTSERWWLISGLY